ncbi:MAG TPA: NUDIX hydrolase [Pseudonocardiaceae bacterium]|jgi:hypothetical protein
MREAGAAAVAVGLLGAAAGALHTATRLDRLHVRTDAGWAGLDAALSRRALVVLGACAAHERMPGCAQLRAAAHAALAAEPADREEVENELGRALAALDRSALDEVWAGQLNDAEQRVMIARRVYNDAVRDTLALRAHRSVRWLRLAGTAPLPRYFEITEVAQQD